MTGESVSPSKASLRTVSNVWKLLAKEKLPPPWGRRINSSADLVVLSRVASVKQILLMITVVALVGCTTNSTSQDGRRGPMTLKELEGQFLKDLKRR